ncbi:hypothetical protein LCL61_08810 [Amycolatopsis coloradensis]|uniref:Uncharacterized protein n=1 Tax=Amycolatopsis coloradensis TaxID=76021 RepID=A0ACD5BD52_9PSEU
MVDEEVGNEKLASKTGPGKQPPEGKGGGGGGLERVTVNLGPRASRALEKAVGLTGDSKTDTINRALQVYAYLEEVWANGGQVLIRNRPDNDEVTVLKFF